MLELSPETIKILNNISKIAPEIGDRVPEFDILRRIPKDIIEKLVDAGVFKMLLPKSFGGGQVGTFGSVKILEEIAKIDGSLAWVTMIGVETPQLTSLLSKEIYQQLYGNGETPLLGGTFLPSGEAKKVDGGYMVSGRWAYSSGCQNWDWFFANCVILDENGERMPGKVEGTPFTRAMIIPADKCQIEDTWKTMGMRGTGSHHFNCSEVFIPEEYTLDILFDKPNIKDVGHFPIADFNSHIGAVILGIAQGAIDDFVVVSQQKKRLGLAMPAAKNPVIQYRVGRAQAIVNSLRSYLHDTARWIETLTGDEVFANVNAPISLMNAWIAEACSDVVDTIWSLAGAHAAYEGSVFQRRLRDVKVAAQHAAVTDAAFTAAGARLFGEVVKIIPQTQVPPDVHQKSNY